MARTGTGGHAFIDRALYLPKSWTDDPDRRAAAGVPEDVEFATKPELARRLIARALDTATPAGWVAGDEVYGADPRLRSDLHSRGIGYVLAVARNHHVVTGIGSRRAVDLAVRRPAQAWHRISAGPGAKVQRWYDWALVEATVEAPGCHWLLIRRNRRTGEYAFYRAHAPHPVPLAALVRVAGRRWAVEESFQTGKELTALDEHQVRGWTSWHRWTILAMLAHAFLSVTAVAEQANPPPVGLIPLTRNEIRHLFITLIINPVRGIAHRLHWSRWRRRHQARAQTSHYRRQEAALA